MVWVHGGPTGQVSGVLDLEKAYFTSRGIGVIDVNYGGSSGYGRQYRERLRRQWGIVDVQDAIAAARSLAKAGDADPARLAIRGGSAGGWTALAAVTTGTARGQVFSAATSYYGVSDLRGFARETHDFESRYLDGLIGPLPGFEAVYAERAPVGHVNDATCPILLLQGLDDPVVPPAQSESIAADLAAHGIRHAYMAFEGESHGFRKAETIMRRWRPSCRSTARSSASRRRASRPVMASSGGRSRAKRAATGRRDCREPGCGGLAGELDGARLADHGDPDLAGVGQLLLDLLGHVPGDDLGLDVVDVARLDHDPDLPAGLHGEDLLDAVLGAARSARAAPAA